MPETVYNLFLMFNDGVCQEVRFAAHDVELSDDAACTFLQQRVAMDLIKAQSIRLAKSFTVEEYEARQRLGTSQHLWDELYMELNASQQPLSVVTSVVDGVPQTRFLCEFGDANIYLRPDLVPGVEMEDWMIKYRTAEGLDLPRLINDDFFAAVKVTFNSRLYVSSMKLLLSGIDSLAFIEFGENGQNVFVNWLEAYADLSPIGITPDELWELRNGLLHMTNLDSRKVQCQKVRRLSFHVGPDPYFIMDGIHSFSFYELVMIMARSLPRWLQTYSEDQSKLLQFVSRYDRILSDSRRANLSSGNGHTS